MRAEKPEPETIAEALDLIGALFRIAKDIKAHTLTGDAKRAYRQTHAKPPVDAFFAGPMPPTMTHRTERR